MMSAASFGPAASAPGRSTPDMRRKAACCRAFISRDAFCALNARISSRSPDIDPSADDVVHGATVGRAMAGGDRICPPTFSPGEKIFFFQKVVEFFPER